MAENRYTYDELLGKVDGNDYEVARAAAGALALVPRDVADKVSAQCFFLRINQDGIYLPGSVLEGRSVIGFESDFFVKFRNNPAKQTEIILRGCAHHMLGHQKGWEHKDPGEDMEADMLAHQWIANWANI